MTSTSEAIYTKLCGMFLSAVTSCACVRRQHYILEGYVASKYIIFQVKDAIARDIKVKTQIIRPPVARDLSSVNISLAK